MPENKRGRGRPQKSRRGRKRTIRTEEAVEMDSVSTMVTAMGTDLVPAVNATTEVAVAIADSAQPSTSGQCDEIDLDPRPFQIYISRKKRRLNSPPMSVQHPIWSEAVVLLPENSDTASSQCTQVTQEIEDEISMPVAEVPSVLLERNSYFLLSDESNDTELDSSLSPEIKKVTETKRGRGRPKKPKRGRKRSLRAQKAVEADSVSMDTATENNSEPTVNTATEVAATVDAAQPSTSVQYNTSELSVSSSQTNKGKEKRNSNCDTNAVADASLPSVEAPQPTEEELTLFDRCKAAYDSWKPNRNMSGKKEVATRARCVAAGSMSQGALGNTQCVAMASCGAAYSTALRRAVFTDQQVDLVLRHANRIYYEHILQGASPRLIEPEQMVTSFQVGSFKFFITIDYGFNCLYPNSPSQMNDAVSQLETVLTTMFNDVNHNPDMVSYLMTGQHETISFWQKKNIVFDEEGNELSELSSFQYYVFNSHSIDEFGLHSPNNVARLFEMDSLQSLAKFLLQNTGFSRNYSQFQLHRLRVNEVINTSEDSDVIIESADIESEENKSPNKGGRPKKLAPGRPKIKENAHLEAVKKYTFNNPEVHREAVKKYTQENPQVNREAVKKYTQENPQVNREAVKKYTQENPQVNREAVKKYTQENPQVHREAVKKYTQENPQVNREAVKRYKTNFDKLIGQKTGDDLKTVHLFSLKKIKLDNDTACPHCHAEKFHEELSRKQWCCGEGRYNVLQHILPPLNADFYNYPQFIRYARAYNNLFAFSALGVSHGFQHPPDGLYFLKIQGRTYHRVFDYSYNLTTNPIGMYIDDGEERKRLAANQNLDQSIIDQIDNHLNAVNPLIAVFRRLHNETSNEAFLMFEPTNRRTHGNILGDMPRGQEVAAVIATDREQYVPRSIAIWKVGEGRPHTVPIFHPLYEALQYPLLYPNGCAGWTPDLHHNSCKVSQLKYYRCLLLSDSRFSNFCRLSDEWLVDMYCRIEEERLKFLNARQNCTEQRVAEAAEIRHVIEQLNDDETIQGEGGRKPGKVYLVNTFTGSPRYMKTKFLDAMALVNRLGKPSYFLTMTCNPKWPEIAENTPRTSLMPSPGLCARVFELKLRQLITDLKSGKWFGKVEYLMYVIEFQKRGLPHAHVAFRVEGGGPTQNIDIDKVVRADIPSPEEADGRLREMVLKHMIHGPCGTDNRTDIPCWDHEKKQCTKRFPKRVTDTTYADERGFVHYKRNENNLGVIKYRNRDITVSDTWVVPYNAPLLLKYDCHINLEISAVRKVIKYLFKYITKGPDEARVGLTTEPDNEIENYVTKRYIGACDAAWRIFEFTLTSREPNVKQLTVHLEDQQMVTFRRGQESQAVAQSNSDLMKYFNRPTGPEFEYLTYQDFYENYILHTKPPQSSTTTVYKSSDDKYFVTKRQRGEMVTRLFWVTPNRGEQFYLRMLLSSYPCRSFNDLKALGGDGCITFQEAARAVGLANDEEEYERCLLEAAGFYTGKKLRHFFVLLITNGAPAAILWDKFKHIIGEDHLERHPNNEELAYNVTLLDIDRLLRKQGSCLLDHGLPNIQDDSTELSRERLAHDVSRLESYVTQWLPLLSTEQKTIFDYIKLLLTDENATASNTNCVFVDGPSGTGKTLLLNVITAYVRGVLKKVAICTASSGIAAQNYEGGCTAHSMFRLPLELVDDHSHWNLTNGTQRAELIREASLIIYDEAPMSHKFLIHLLDRSLRDLMDSPKPFGGKIIIFAGDFRQIPPVVKNAKTPNDILNASLKTSPLWPTLLKFSLTQAQRTRSDEEYSSFLLDLGSGKYNVTPTSPINLQGLDVVTQLDDLITFVFPPEVLSEPDVCASRPIITTHNNNVKEINSFIADRIEGDYIHCLSADSVNPELANEFHLGTDLLNNVHANGVPDHELKIKKGAMCMIMRNLSFVDGLVNGTKVIITDVSPRLLTVRKPGSDDIYLIPRICFNVPIEAGSPIEMCRRQFPVQLCYAMTVHKSQGQTIEKVGIDLRSDVFSHGQLYVALGRVRNKSNIKVLIPPEKIIDKVPYTNNVIIPALIQ